LEVAQASSTTVPLPVSSDSVSGEPSSQSSDSTSATVAGSTADTRMSLPSCSPPAKLSDDTVRTPSTCPASRAAPGLIGEKPSVFCRTTSPWKLRSIALLIEALMPAANTVTKTTTARPIMSAPAVTAVRPGLRTAFSRARRPVIPLSFSSGQPDSEASGRTSRGLNIDTPSSVATAPPPTEPAAALDSSPPNRPTQVSATPPSTSNTATAAKTLPRRWLSGSSASSSAAIGDTRVARSAGESAAASVTTMPTTSAITIVRVAITVPVFGRSIPKLLNIAFRPPAKPIPASTPATDPSAPMMVASSTIPRRIWPREAPSVRSMPSSRIRWATVIEKVLKIRKLPTRSATPPNTSSTMRKKARSSLMSSDCRSAAWTPVSTVRRAGSTRSMLRASSASETPSAASTEMASNWPCFSVRRWASSSVSWAVPAPPDEVLPSRWSPTIS
jgi:hypothetical protein